jgi:peptidoglycan hydrolase CwlO-like protein
VGTLAIAAISLGVISPQLAETAPRQDPRAERERVRAQQAEVASKIDTSKATLSEIDDALQTLSDNLRTQEAALARTEAEVAQAEKDIADAEAAIERLEEEIVTLRAEIRRRAVQAFVRPPGDDVLSILQTKDFVTASNRKFYIELRSQDDADVADRLNGALAQIDFEREQATEARERAERKRVEQAERTEAVRKARAEQQSLADQIQGTIDDQIALSIELAATDRALSKKIAEQQAALVARLAAEKAAADEAARQQAAQQAAAPPSNQAPGGGETAPLPPVGGGGGAGTGTGGISLCSVGGITINCAIQSQVAALLNAARADGLSLSGGGYRDPAQQIALRKQHCGTSYYAIYQMSPNSCRPPTARPGQSQHEIGLAIDFSNCSSRGTACYQWLAGNASRFGFYNLPSEPWHWSTTGS